MQKFSDKLTPQNSPSKESKGQVKKRKKPLRKIPSSIHRRWGLAARLEHPRTKEKRK